MVSLDPLPLRVRCVCGGGAPGLSQRLVAASDPRQPLACRHVTDFCLRLRVAPCILLCLLHGLCLD